MSKINSIFLKISALTAIALGCLFLGACSSPQEIQNYDLDLSDLILRDPYVFADEDSQKYYIHGNALINKNNPQKNEIEKGKALYCYESRDLKKWRLVGKSFKAPKNWWGKRDFWAPDMFKFDDKYYIIATFSNDRVIGKWFNNPNRDLKFRGCAVLVSDNPEGPYKPLTDKPITPENWMCLDGTIFEEDDKLYLLYCREWVEVGDGEIYAQEISRDLKKCVGKPIKLFSASQAPWVQPVKKGAYVTDAPVVNRSKDGSLFMTWSSRGEVNSKGQYVIGLAYSENNKLLGKWIHSEIPLNADDGGHAMLFKTFTGRHKISYHAGNSFPERTVIKNFRYTDRDAIISDWKILVDVPLLNKKYLQKQNPLQ